MGGARNNFNGGEEIGGKEERNGGAIVVKFFFFFFERRSFVWEKRFRYWWHFPLSLSFLNFSFELEEKKRDESVKVTC